MQYTSRRATKSSPRSRSLKTSDGSLGSLATFEDREKVERPILSLPRIERLSGCSKELSNREHQDMLDA